MRQDNLRCIAEEGNKNMGRTRKWVEARLVETAKNIYVDGIIAGQA
jgi:hypothetical protein